MNLIKITTRLFRKPLLKIHFLAILFYTVLLLNANKATGQPYIDIANLKYSISPDAGLFNQNKNNIKLQFFGAGSNIPIQFKNKKDALIFSPFYENWSSQYRK